MPVFTVVGLARAPGLKLVEGEEMDEDEEVFLGSTNFEIPKSLDISENQSLRNLMRKSVFTFSPFVSALLVADENRSFILKVSLFLTIATTVALSSRKDASFVALANELISWIS